MEFRSKILVIVAPIPSQSFLNISPCLIKLLWASVTFWYSRVTPAPLTLSLVTRPTSANTQLIQHERWDGPGSDLLCNFRRYLLSNEDISNCVGSCAGDLDGLLDQRRNKISKTHLSSKRQQKVGNQIKAPFFYQMNKQIFILFQLDYVFSYSQTCRYLN